MKNIIFDWSGVVKDGVVGHLWAVNKTFNKHGIPTLSLEEFKENWVQPHHIFYDKYLPNISLEEEARDYKEALLSSDYPKVEPFTGIVELIKSLKSQGYFMAVVSSDLPETILKEIDEWGLSSTFDEVISDVNDKLESVKSLINKHNLDLKNTYFIGDSNHEIDVSKKVGIKSIAVTWGFCSESKLISHNPDYLVKNVSELEKIFKNN